MESYIDLFTNSFSAFGKYMWSEITFQVDPWYINYFWLLIALSVVVWGLEIVFPWRKNQPIIRKDFWLDFFYMFFNFYLFKLVIFMAVSNVAELAFRNVFGGSVDSLAIFDVSSLAPALQLVIFFVATDFIQWFIHVLLHKYNFLWQFHKVHHSVEQMGFAAHLRYHWMENIFYTPMKYLMVMIIGGFQVEHVFICYYIAIAIGHLNHANVNITWGPLKYIFNSPAMHIWHHAKAMPEHKPSGINFGISLSVWDYIFRTAWVPSSGRDLKLGFSSINRFPKTFFRQLIFPFFKADKK
jgi:sterol desaturase/sphingolipid hydroxylase (fatty acid hydroxylase superfamily)